MIAHIVARAENGVIGSKNDLPWYLPADLQHFKELTTGQVVIMGRKTMDSIWQRLGHALPDRRNVVLTRNASAYYEGVEVINDVERIRDLGRQSVVFIAGGSEVYWQTLHLAEKLYVTEVKADIEGDAHFPDIDPSVWREVSRDRHTKDDRNQYDYDFVEYERIHETN